MELTSIFYRAQMFAENSSYKVISNFPQNPSNESKRWSCREYAQPMADWIEKMFNIDAQGSDFVVNTMKLSPEINFVWQFFAIVIFIVSRTKPSVINFRDQRPECFTSLFVHWSYYLQLVYQSQCWLLSWTGEFPSQKQYQYLDSYDDSFACKNHFHINLSSKLYLLSLTLFVQIFDW